jgi:hypothetical protein
MSAADGDVAQRLGQLERLIGEVERLDDVEARGKMRAIVRALLELHGAGLARVLAIAGECGAPIARAIDDACVRDPLVSSLLLLHGLHPRDLESRVRAALAELGGDVELIAVADDVVRVQVRSPALRAAVEAALLAAAPDAAAIEIEDGAALIPAARLGTGARR